MTVLVNRTRSGTPKRSPVAAVLALIPPFDAAGRFIAVVRDPESGKVVNRVELCAHPRSSNDFFDLCVEWEPPEWQKNP